MDVCLRSGGARSVVGVVAPWNWGSVKLLFAVPLGEIT